LQAKRINKDLCEGLPLSLAHVGDKKAKLFHFSEIIGRLPYVRATVTICRLSAGPQVHVTRHQRLPEFVLAEVESKLEYLRKLAKMSPAVHPLSLTYCAGN
jgi:hypothetical protein